MNLGWLSKLARHRSELKSGIESLKGR